MISPITIIPPITYAPIINRCFILEKKSFIFCMKESIGPLIFGFGRGFSFGSHFVGGILIGGGSFLKNSFILFVIQYEYIYYQRFFYDPLYFLIAKCTDRLNSNMKFEQKCKKCKKCKMSKI